MKYLFEIIWTAGDTEWHGGLKFKRGVYGITFNFGPFFVGDTLGLDGISE